MYCFNNLKFIKSAKKIFFNRGGTAHFSQGVATRMNEVDKQLSYFVMKPFYFANFLDKNEKIRFN